MFSKKIIYSYKKKMYRVNVNKYVVLTIQIFLYFDKIKIFETNKYFSFYISITYSIKNVIHLNFGEYNVHILTNYFLLFFYLIQ